MAAGYRLSKYWLHMLIIMFRATLWYPVVANSESTGIMHMQSFRMLAQNVSEYCMFHGDSFIGSTVLGSRRELYFTTRMPA